MHWTNRVTTAIVLVLLIASVTLMAMPVQAQEEAHGGAPGTVTGGPLPTGVTPSITVTTTAFISISPNPVGLGQFVLVNLWLGPALPVSRAHTGYTVTFTKPDGTTDKVGPVNSFVGDTTAWFEYVVQQVGTWTAKFNFAGDYYPAGYYLTGSLVPNGTAGATNLDSAYYQPSSSPDIQFTVQSELVPSWPASTLPNDYWTRPIFPNNREWYAIAGNFPWRYASGHSYEGPYVTGPNTGHIVWRRQDLQGGIIGDEYTQAAFALGSSFDVSSDMPSIIFQGRCYQTLTKTMPVLTNGTYYNTPTTVWECYDLRTGQVYWDLQGITQPPTRYSYQIGAPTVPGTEFRLDLLSAVLVYLGSRLIEYNPFSGAVVLNISLPVTTGNIYNDPYVLSVQTLGSGANTTYRLINWTMAGTSTNFTSRIANNITWPFSSLGTADFVAGLAVSSATLTSSATGMSSGTRLMGASLTTGQLLYNVTTPDIVYSGSTSQADHGKYAFAVEGERCFDCFDMLTGQRLWRSELTAYPWGDFWDYSAQSAYDLLYAETYAGVYAFNWTTGKIVWNYQEPAPAYETPYSGGYSWFSPAIVADGKIYAYNGEHSPSTPLSRGWKLYSINATTGELIWKVMGQMDPGAVADGYLVAGSNYDGYMYVFGKGQSATTITTSPGTISKGSQVLIQGTVTDESPATASSQNYAPGKPVPCVSENSTSTWMNYLYMQMPIDGLYHNETVTGVQVILTAIGSDGTVIDIGTVTTNGYYGTFSKAWTPPNEDTFTITASFAGDGSYGSSSAAMAVSVGPAPEPIQFPQTPTPADYTMTIIGAAIAIMIVVVIVGVLLYRKK